jgi:hypothetical protein
MATCRDENNLLDYPLTLCPVAAATAPVQADIRVIVIAFHSEELDAITRIIRRYTCPKGDVISDYTYNAGKVTTALKRHSRIVEHLGLPSTESSLCQDPILDGFWGATDRAVITRRGCIEFMWVRE